MLEATRLTRAGQLAEASALLQRALRGETARNSGSGPTGDTGGAPAGRTWRMIDVVPETIEVTDPHPLRISRPAFGRGFSGRTADRAEGWAGPPMPEALRSLLERVQPDRSETAPGLWTGWREVVSRHTPDVVPDGGGQFVDQVFSNGSRTAAPTSSTSPAAIMARRFRWSSCCTAAPSRPTTSPPARA